MSRNEDRLSRLREQIREVDRELIRLVGARRDLAQRIRLRLSERPFETPGGTVALTASLGVALSLPEEDSTLVELLF